MGEQPNPWNLLQLQDVSWVQNVVRQFGPYPLQAQEI